MIQEIQILASPKRWERGTRFYEAELGVDLFNTPCVTVTYGQVGSRRGRRYTLPFSTTGEAEAAAVLIARRRIARHYWPVVSTSARKTTHQERNGATYDYRAR